MKLELIERYYDIASVFNDSISLIAVLLIIHDKTDLNFADIKEQLSELEFGKSTIDAIVRSRCSVSKANARRETAWPCGDREIRI